MKKLVISLILASFVSIPTWAETVEPQVPNQEVQNTKSYTGINYNRQDSEQVGTQKIVNDHSWFNINVNIIKKGALFQKDKTND